MRLSTTTLQNAFGKYLKIAMDGEDLIITRNGQGVAILKRYREESSVLVKDGAEAYHYDKRVSYKEFLKYSEESDKYCELIDGKIYLMSSPRHEHQAALAEINFRLFNYFSDKGCKPYTAPYDIKMHNDSPSFEEDPNVVQPDIVVICDPDNINEKGFYEGIPSLVVEVLSPSTRSKDMIAKLQLYLKSGVKEYWIVDVEQKTVLLYSFKDRELEMSMAYKGDSVIESISFSGLKMTLGEVFA